METTIKVSKETKDRILKLDLSGKSKTFDMIINDLVTYYDRSNEDHKKNLDVWNKGIDRHKKNTEAWEKEFGKKEKERADYNKRLKDYEKEKKVWDRLIKWAKEQGFKG